MLRNRSKLTSLMIYRNILQDGIIKQLETLQENEMPGDLAAAIIRQAEELGLEGHLLKNYIIYLIGYGENVFSRTAEQNLGEAGESLCQAAAHDIAILKEFLLKELNLEAGNAILADYHPTYTKMDERFRMLSDYLLDITDTYTPAQVVAMLGRHYYMHGYGDMASHRAFRWDEDRELVGIKYCDPVRLDEIVGYEQQKAVILRNTEAFVAGRPANNVLLVGARGTGKSSTVKALANQYYEQGLRLVEVSKKDLEYLPRIMNTLRQWGKKFILFLDDLSFEEFEVSYKNLKSVMDGGVECRPENVLIYATSNRRHLIREGWSDRSDDDIHQQDTVNEKISLSDRFGIMLTFTSPTQDEYLRIVEDIARKSCIKLPAAELKTKALRWETAHSGRSGRVARQFIANLAGDSIS